MLSRDTSPDAERFQIELWRAMSPPQKLGLDLARQVYPGVADLTER